MRSNPALFWIVGGAVAAAAACFVSMLAATGGALSMPLDDAFIFFQYARRMVEGGPLTYQAGDGVTAGATSLLTVAVHAVGYLAGFRGEAMAVFALLLGAASLAWAGASAHRIGRRWIPEHAWLAPLLLLGSGPVVWGFLSGMDLPLFVALALAWLASWPSDDSPPRRSFFLLGALLGLARPDALFLVAGGFAAWLVAGRRLAGGWALPWAGAALPFVLQILLTGRAQSASMEVKSLLARPDLTFGQWIVEGVNFIAFTIKGIYGGGAVENAARVAANDASGAVFYTIPFALALVTLGLVPGAWREARERRGGLHLALLLGVGLLVAAQAFTVPRNWHWNRYLIPVHALLAPALAVGLSRAGRLVEAAWPELRRGDGARALGALAAVLLVPGLVYFTVAYGRNCADIRFQHIELARRIAALPDVDRNTVVAVHDVGALKYFGTYRVLDLEGLADPRFRIAGRLGSAGIWETLERTPDAERPRLLAVYASWFDPAFLAPHRTLFSQRQFRPSIAAGNPLTVYAADWSAAGRGDRPRDPAIIESLAGWTLLGEIDVADFESERAGGYRHRVLDGAYADVLRALPSVDGAVVMEGGRLISGGESFRVGGFQPGGEILLVARTSGPFRIRVSAGGRAKGIWSASGAENAWQEAAHRFPAGDLPAGALRFELASDDPHHSAYASFHYWVYQRRP